MHSSARLQHMEKVLAGREWLAGAFSITDILMADVLRLVGRFGGLEEYPACSAYAARATARPAFQKAYADQRRISLLRMRRLIRSESAGVRFKNLLHQQCFSFQPGF